MPKTLKPDHGLFLATLALVALGVAMVFSASTVTAEEKFGDANHFWLRQLMAGALGTEGRSDQWSSRPRAELGSPKAARNRLWTAS